MNSTRPNNPEILIYDTTLRDGLGMEGLSLSLQDKLEITKKLDLLGVHYIEGGYPGSNPKDAEFFQLARDLTLLNAKLVAFGSTRKPGGNASSDPAIRAVLDAGTEVITLVGKASSKQVTEVLQTTEEENLLMIRDSFSECTGLGKEAIFDAEHFFDGYVARAMSQQSALGKFLDPIADKLLVGALLVMLAAFDRIPGVAVVPAVVILCREILVSGLREFLGGVKISVPVSKLAQWKTTLQMFMLGFLLVGPVGPMFGPFSTTDVGVIGLWIAAILTLVTGYDYLRAGLRHVEGMDVAAAAMEKQKSDPPPATGSH